MASGKTAPPVNPALGVIVGFVADDEWEFYEVEETPSGGHHDAWAALLKRRPELAQVADRDIRVDVICGRDGISRHRFAVRRIPSPEPPPRVLP